MCVSVCVCVLVPANYVIVCFVVVLGRWGVEHSRYVVPMGVDS